MALKDVVDAVGKEFGEAVSNVDLEGVEPHFEVRAADWPRVAFALRKKHGVDYLACITSIDRGDGLEAVYNLESMKDTSICFSVRVKCSYEEPKIPSVEDVWRTADWHEREAFDLMGIHFEGHHNLRRILCAEDWEGHPLRKDYQSPDYYHGIRNNVV